MLYHWLYPLADTVPGLNVVRYITFRTAAATLTALFISFIVGPWLIPRLAALRVGQPIREIGPAHAAKAGTPTMGGLLIVTAFYPGSPTSEILDTLYLLSGEYIDLRMEVSVNEKVALETVAGASMAGVRGFTSMKSVGLNVASDTFYTLGYTGVNAGCVLLVADDPHAHSSQSEQDGRFFASSGHVPMLEPSTPQEAYEMVKYAFEISEKHRILTLIRTRVNHQYAPVQINEVKRRPVQKKTWKNLWNNNVADLNRLHGNSPRCCTFVYDVLKFFVNC